ncbi:MAG: L-cysteine:1D-myo-inositol 2-amino-2-deoxy-alpha-D-glucopyranoside ligase [Actinomycetota bacterium]|nr:L-cysteine:1D-myo-inositol 2-amino-2-deoxy-alpha-D-glucopyranoside ligase [Actinomycetota bacterium]
MRSWNRPKVPQLPGHGEVPRIFDTASGRIAEAKPDGVASIYVCGITPYDSTHIGHAATYLTYDTLIRLWLDAGYDVNYVQNTTDVDDPLLERAHATGVDWRQLASDQTERFRRDMESLAVIPPDHYIAVTEKMFAISGAVASLVERDIAYRVDDDIYFDIAAAEAVAPWHLGDESHYDRQTMLELSGARGGDPDRSGKRDPLDPLLWRAAREGEPNWASVLGRGRPGWHIECSVIAAEYLDLPLTVKGGGSDLIFPHHEFSAGHTAAITATPLAALYSHAGLVAYRGTKMSKSLGNLVLVGSLTESGVDPRAIRLVLLGQRYRENWEWTEALLASATGRLEAWDAWASSAVAGDSSVLPRLRVLLAQDLDTPAGLAEIDSVIESGIPATTGDLDAIEALLGLRLG